MLNSQRQQDTRGEYIIIHMECRCARITRFIARVLNFIMDCTNAIRNWILYKFFIDTLKSFYKIIGFFGSITYNKICNFKLLSLVW